MVLRQARVESPEVPPMVIYGKGVKNVRVRFWPPAVVYDKPPVSLHSLY